MYKLKYKAHKKTGSYGNLRTKESVGVSMKLSIGSSNNQITFKLL